ncbi:DUF402 domain-containing protein [Amycolatopsis sp. NPDC059657]|uniref:DUF402 domain-containing protein n=1 Tax=Amycolatopsis sp. NPDC059657 TaxID=3346899 RepID=UPI0036708D48
MHPPKLETFDIAAETNVDPKGIVREVEQYRLTESGLYMARPVPGRPQFHYLESWILPGLSLRVNDFWFNPGHERDQDFYLDVVTVTVDGGVWLVKDLYIDLVLKEKQRLDVIDTDELIAAAKLGLITEDEAEHALKTTYAAVDGLAANGYELGRWLSTMELSWRRH